jgi:Cu/Ag efflux protein CusF
MKRSVWILVALLGLGSATGAWSQNDQEKDKRTKPGPDTPDPNNPGGPPTHGSKGTTTKTTAKTTAHKITGDISKVDCAAMILTVGTTELTVTDTTHITMSGKKAACADLKDGAKATASYTTKDGKNIARYVSVK